MTDSDAEVDAVWLPNQYGAWTLQAFEYGSDDHIATFSYERTVNETTQFTVFVEEEPDGTYGGALLDTGQPENPHRDAIDRFYADTIEEALKKAKTFMDRDLSQYYR